MNSVSKSLATLALAATALVSLQAQAVVVTFGGQDMNGAGGDKSGLTSKLAGPGNTSNPLLGIYGETFDQATAIKTAENPTGLNNTPLPAGVSVEAGCQINSLGAVSITVGGGGFGVVKGSESFAATPAGDSTCFGFGPDGGNKNLKDADGNIATARIDYSNLLAGLSAANGGATFKINYLGLYYGSIDNYNNIAFFDGIDLLKAEGTLLADGVLSGEEVLKSQGGKSGDQKLPGSNVYVNFDFAADELFTAFEFRTTGIAFELDNIYVRVTQIPEPASLALVGLGLVGVAAARRRKQAK